MAIPIVGGKQTKTIPFVKWLQHEFFHYFYNIFNELNLETNKGHDWFDRNFWPKDFKGNFEEDYYKESMDKRIKRSSPTWYDRFPAH